jgi:hypothetical protein
VSLSVNGSQEGHDSLRQLAATEVEREVEQRGNILCGLLEYSPDDGLPFNQHIKMLQTNGVAV